MESPAARGALSGCGRMDLPFSFGRRHLRRFDRWRLRKDRWLWRVPDGDYRIGRSPSQTPAAASCQLRCARPCTPANGYFAVPLCPWLATRPRTGMTRESGVSSRDRLILRDEGEHTCIHQLFLTAPDRNCWSLLRAKQRSSHRRRPCVKVAEKSRSIALTLIAISALGSRRNCE